MRIIVLGCRGDNLASELMDAGHQASLITYSADNALWNKAELIIIAGCGCCREDFQNSIDILSKQQQLWKRYATPNKPILIKALDNTTLAKFKSIASETGSEHVVDSLGNLGYSEKNVDLKTMLIIRMTLSE